MWKSRNPTPLATRTSLAWVIFWIHVFSKTKSVSEPNHLEALFILPVVHSIQYKDLSLTVNAPVKSTTYFSLKFEVVHKKQKSHTPCWFCVLESFFVFETSWPGDENLRWAKSIANVLILGRGWWNFENFASSRTLKRESSCPSKLINF